MKGERERRRGEKRWMKMRRKEKGDRENVNSQNSSLHFDHFSLLPLSFFLSYLVSSLFTSIGKII